MLLAEVNRMSREQFAAALGFVFEDSPWVAERAWSVGPFPSVDQLHGAMTAQVEAASFEEKLRLLRAHPDLGARARMSAASVREQSDAGFLELTEAEFAELSDLNRKYRDKFGFPFLFAVKGADKGAIIDALRLRLNCTYEMELEQALAQVYRIARFRLQDLLQE